MASSTSLLLLLCMVPLAALAADVKLEYYTNAHFDCNDTLHNFTNSAPITSRYWLLPDGSLSTGNSTDGHIIVDSDFNIVINRVDDGDFGYYACILVRSDQTIDTIRHGLNIDGPYYGDLLAMYSKKAMIGGIAAGSVFVILAGLCVVWQFRYHKRVQRNKAVDELDLAIDGYDLKTYTNIGLETDEDTSRSAQNDHDIIANGNSPDMSEKPRY